MVEQGDVFSGLVVDSVSGMQYFAEDNRMETPADVAANVRPFVQGGYERNDKTWKVLSTFELIEDERFRDVAQW